MLEVEVLNKINVLGTDYTVCTEKTNKSIDGFCDTSIKKIVVDDMQPTETSKKDLELYKKQVLRHEIIHAFLFESGLEAECRWNDEEMVDWLAIQFDKILKTFKDCGVASE